jgi:hypothetical protein
MANQIPSCFHQLAAAIGSLFCCAQAPAQNIDNIINASAVEKIERVLSSDDMQGRGTFTAGIEKAADSIEAQFRAAGLKPWNDGGPSPTYRQSFSLIRSKLISIAGDFDGRRLNPALIFAFTSASHLTIDGQREYEKVFIRAGDDLVTTAARYIKDKKNYLVLVDTSFSNSFSLLANFRDRQFKSGKSLVFVLSTTNPVNYTFQVEQEITESKLANIAGILPGRARKKEYVIFSGHYDHLGIGNPDARNDSIYNGANDDASGTTAVIMLARYFASLSDNERTLIFVAFTAEENGGYGSQYFSGIYDPASVIAMFNIEMIGTESKWGRNSAFITGYEKTDMGKILRTNLEGSRFKFFPDPYPQEELFYRSDNATLARQGVPAHTISTSKMDSEKYYHTQGDEIGTLDMDNMAGIIRAIALSSRSIIAGSDTPSRVNTEQLQ